MSRLFFLIFISSELSVQFASNLLLRTTKIYELAFVNNKYGLSQPREIKCRFSHSQALAYISPKAARSVKAFKAMS
jgi:hypothetical protein